jgi:hypothetical protein
MQAAIPLPEAVVRCCGYYCDELCHIRNGELAMLAKYLPEDTWLSKPEELPYSILILKTGSERPFELHSNQCVRTITREELENEGPFAASFQYEDTIRQPFKRKRHCLRKMTRPPSSSGEGEGEEGSSLAVDDRPSSWQCAECYRDVVRVSSLRSQISRVRRMNHVLSYQRSDPDDDIALTAIDDEQEEEDVAAAGDQEDHHSDLLSILQLCSDGRQSRTLSLPQARKALEVLIKYITTVDGGRSNSSPSSSSTAASSCPLLVSGLPLIITHSLFTAMVNLD